MKKIILSAAVAMCSFAAMAQFSNGAFLLSEGMYGSASGSLYWLPLETFTFGENSTEINGKGYGESSPFATVYGDRLYITSKQVGSYGGGILDIADAATMRSMYTFSQLSDDGHNYDGRAFCGVSETKGYLGTSNGIFVIDLQHNTIDKFIEGTDCGYSVGESIDGGYYQYDVYWNQIGSMVRVGDYVFASQQNRGILVINAATDEIETIISAENYSGSFGDLVLAKDGSLWTTTCTQENYSYDHTPETNYLIKIDPYTFNVETVEVSNKISVAWSTWRVPMMQASKHHNMILWRNVHVMDWSGVTTEGGPQICYYDIDTQQEGVLVDLSTFDSSYFIYSGFSVDPETNLIYVPVATGGYYGPWYLLIIDPTTGQLVTPAIQIPIGDWSDYPSMVLFTDDYAPEFNLEEKYELNTGEMLELNLLDIVSDSDNLDAGIIVEIADGGDSSIAEAKVENGKLIIEKKSADNTQIVLKANSNGKIATGTINLSGKSSGINAIEANSAVCVNYSAGVLTIQNGMNEQASVYDISGRCVASVYCDNDNYKAQLPLAPGIYVISVGNTTSKIVVK